MQEHGQRGWDQDGELIEAQVSLVFRRLDIGCGESGDPGDGLAVEQDERAGDADFQG